MVHMDLGIADLGLTKESNPSNFDPLERIVLPFLSSIIALVPIFRSRSNSDLYLGDRHMILIALPMQRGIKEMQTTGPWIDDLNPKEMQTTDPWINDLNPKRRSPLSKGGINLFRLMGFGKLWNRFFEVPIF